MLSVKPLFPLIKEKNKTGKTGLKQDLIPFLEERKIEYIDTFMLTLNIFFCKEKDRLDNQPLFVK